jgi:hypothetical protein
MTIRKEGAAALKLDRKEQEIVVFDDPGLSSFPHEWTKEPILHDPAGNLVQSWSPKGNA